MTPDILALSIIIFLCLVGVVILVWKIVTQRQEDRRRKEREDKWHFSVEDARRNWTTDYQLENGNYKNICVYCLNHFMGHKHRRICRVCDERLR